MLSNDDGNDGNDGNDSNDGNSDDDDTLWVTVGYLGWVHSSIDKTLLMHSNR